MSHAVVVPMVAVPMIADDDPRTVFLRLVRATAQVATACLENGVPVEWVRTELVARGLDGFEPDNLAIDRDRPDLVFGRRVLRRSVERAISEFHQRHPEG